MGFLFSEETAYTTMCPVNPHGCLVFSEEIDIVCPHAFLVYSEDTDITLCSIKKIHMGVLWILYSVKKSEKKKSKGFCVFMVLYIF